MLPSPIRSELVGPMIMFITNVFGVNLDIPDSSDWDNFKEKSKWPYSCDSNDYDENFDLSAFV